MPQAPTRFADEVGIALANLADAATGAFTPTLRLGVTGLSRAGKTIFITALVHNLLTGGRLPGFAALTEGRFIGARLAEYPDAAIPRFAYEDHLAALTGKPATWPESTRRISQLRLTLKYQSRSWLSGFRGPSMLNLDIVDYPGEWLLDLPLLSLSFAEWSADALARARRPAGRGRGRRLSRRAGPKSTALPKPPISTRSGSRPPSRAICATAASTVVRSPRCRPDASCCPATSKARLP